MIPSRPIVLCFAALAAACGPGSIEDLSAPAIGVSIREGGGFCTALYGVDGAGRAWRARDCGSGGGLEPISTVVADAERAQLDAMMDEVLALPDDPECELTSPSDRAYRFVRTGEAASEVRQCGSGTPPVALELARRLEELADPPADAGSGADAG